MTDLTYAYEHTKDRHIWSLVGPGGGVHIWAVENEAPYRHERYYGGIEMHSRKQLYDWLTEPSHTDCWLLKGPCWHDGSSLQFSEQIAPHIERFGIKADDPFIQSELHSRYVSWFGEDK